MRKSIPTNRNQGEKENSSEEDYRSEDDVLNSYTSQTDGYDCEYESTVDSVKNCNVNEYDFSKISCVETESDLEKLENAELNKTIQKSWESKKTNDNMKPPENCVFVTPKINLELWKLLSSW